ncbi:unnamed protein product, partial [Brassica rapa]
MTSSPGMGRSAHLVYALGFVIMATMVAASYEPYTYSSPPPPMYNSPAPKVDYKSPPPPYVYSSPPPP